MSVSSEALAAVALKPAAIIAIAVLAAAVLLTIVFSVLIKRRSAAPRSPKSAAPRPQKRPQSAPARRADPAVPVDMQDRLRRFTATFEATPEESTSRVRAPGHGSGPLTPRPAITVTPPAPLGLATPPASLGGQGESFDDATRFFGDDEPEAEPDSTAFFGDEENLPDATTFFGGQPTAGALPPVRHEEVAHSVAPGEGTRSVAPEEGTRFFGLEDEDVSGHDAAPSATRFFDLDDEEQAPEPSAPRPFANADEQAHAATPSETHFFGLTDDEQEAHPLSETRFFAPDDAFDFDAEDHELVPDGQTGMLQALPPTLKDEVWHDNSRPAAWDGAHADTVEEERFVAPGPDVDDAEDDLMTSTGFLAALPPSMPAPKVDARVLDLMRERLSAMAAPEVLALSVIDGAGRVLAGEADENLAGELYALMDESGQGRAADIEQPVRLADDSHGVILLLPTGADALLGALLREEENAQATRDSLRGLAHEIGDAMRRAS